MRTGWANNCGVELFTNGWVTCEKLLQTLVEDTGGSQFNNFLVFQPVKKELNKKISNTLPVQEAILNNIEDDDIDLDNFVFDVDDSDYGLRPDIPAAKLLDDFKSTNDVIKKAAQRISVPKEQVKRKLIEVVEKELQKQRDFKLAIFKDDEEIIEILLMVGET